MYLVNIISIPIVTYFNTYINFIFLSFLFYSPILGLSTIRNRQNSEESCDFVVGDRVLVSGHRKGTIRFAGETEFATGKIDMSLFVLCLSMSLF